MPRPRANRLSSYLQAYSAQRKAEGATSAVRAAQLLLIETDKTYAAFAAQAARVDLPSLAVALNQQQDVITDRLRDLAALDERNARIVGVMVTRLLHEMTASTDTRFIIITHNPITMARMNRLFGVTMAERGVSQLVSVDLEGAVDILDQHVA